jgi:hypothetical protein
MADLREGLEAWKAAQSAKAPPEPEAVEEPRNLASALFFETERAARIAARAAQRLARFSMGQKAQRKRNSRRGDSFRAAEKRRKEKERHEPE